MSRFNVLAVKVARISTPSRDADGDEFASSIESREFGGITSIVLALHARPFGNQRGGDDFTYVAPLSKRAMHYVARTAGFVTRMHFTLRRRPIQPALQLHQIIGQAIDA